jgi:hypothetical protein
MITFEISHSVFVHRVNKVVKAHPQTFCGTIEEQRQDDWQGAAKYDEISHWHDLAGRQWHSDDGDQEFADDQVYSYRASIVTRLAFKGEAAHGAVFIRFEDTSKYFPSATYRATLAQSPL